MEYFEDFEIGDKFETAGRTISGADITFFSTYIGAWNPLFLDSEHAAKSSFKHRIAPGFLTQSLSLGLLYQARALERFLLVSAKSSFPKPVGEGDTIRVFGEVVSKKEGPSGKSGQVTFRATTTNQHGEAVLQMELLVSVLKRKGPRRRGHG